MKQQLFDLGDLPDYYAPQLMDTTGLPRSQYSVAVCFFGAPVRFSLRQNGLPITHTKWVTP